jgi:hypothetical protein
VSFILLAAVAALTAGAAGALFARRGGPKAAAELPAAPKAEVPVDVLVGLPLAIGDVVSVSADAPGTAAVGAGSRERWLTGALVAREGSTLVAALFFAPEGSMVECVAVFSGPRREIAWLSSAPAELGAEPPSTLEIGGKILERRSRVPVTLERVGRNVPRLGEGATLAEYASGREVALVLRAEGGALALVGVRLDEGEYERMGSGGLS